VRAFLAADRALAVFPAMSAELMTDNAAAY